MKDAGPGKGEAPRGREGHPGKDPLGVWERWPPTCCGSPSLQGASIRAQPGAASCPAQSAQKPSPALWSCKQTHGGESHPPCKDALCRPRSPPSLCSDAQGPRGGHRSEGGQAQASDPPGPPEGRGRTQGEGPCGGLQHSPSMPLREAPLGRAWVPGVGGEPGPGWGSHSARFLLCPLSFSCLAFPENLGLRSSGYSSG